MTVITNNLASKVLRWLAGANQAAGAALTAVARLAAAMEREHAQVRAGSARTARDRSTGIAVRPSRATGSQRGPSAGSSPR